MGLFREQQIVGSEVIRWGVAVLLQLHQEDDTRLYTSDSETLAWHMAICYEVTWQLSMYVVV
jgi:hypothetical protein